MKETDNGSQRAARFHGPLNQGNNRLLGQWNADARIYRLARRLGRSVRRTHGWRTPPRWCPRHWSEEIDAKSIASACQAILIFEPDRGPSLESFVYHRVLSGALVRYRKEWGYALCGCCSSSVPMLMVRT